MDRTLRSFFTNSGTGGNNGGGGNTGGGIVNEADPVALSLLRLRRLTSGALPPAIRLVPDNSAGPVVYPLPTTPTDLTMIEWFAGPVDYSINSLTFQPTDRPISGSASPIRISTTGECGFLIYHATVNQWMIYRSAIAAGGNASSGGYRDIGGVVSVVENGEALPKTKHVFMAAAEVEMPAFELNTIVEFCLSPELPADFGNAKLKPRMGETIYCRADNVSGPDRVIIQRRYPSTVAFKRVAGGWKELWAQ